MDVTIQPQGVLSGSVPAPASKSAAHRAAICAALSPVDSALSPIQMTQDMTATINAATALGAKAHWDGGVLSMQGISTPPQTARLHCGESGSTLRFFVPIAAALGVDAHFYGEGRLPQRPMTPLIDALCGHGVVFDSPKDAILSVRGQLQSGIFALPGDVSSQYITGLLFALPLLQGESEIRLTSPLQSRGYVDMTIDAIQACGVQLEATHSGWRILGGQQYHNTISTIEGDYSGGAFWLCAGALAKGSSLSVTGLTPCSLQGDRAVLDVLQQMGANIVREGSQVTVTHSPLSAVDIDAADIPDLVPILAVTAAVANGTTIIYNAERLRIKESDRLETVTAGLTALGAEITQYPDKLVIAGKELLDGGTVDSFGDHRIAMAMAVAALGCQNPVTILGGECVAKSYPDFWEDYAALGGVVHVL